MSQKYVSLEAMMPVIQEALSSGNTVQFSPRGISMEPMLRQGRDSVTLSPITGPLRKYDIPLYQRSDGAYILHRVVKTGAEYTCIGDNQFALEKGVKTEQMIGVVTGFTRKGKFCSVTDTGYQIYCRFWHYTRFIRRIFRFLRTRLNKLIKR